MGVAREVRANPFFDEFSLKYPNITKYIQISQEISVPHGRRPFSTQYIQISQHMPGQRLRNPFITKYLPSARPDIDLSGILSD